MSCFNLSRYVYHSDLQNALGKTLRMEKVCVVDRRHQFPILFCFMVQGTVSCKEHSDVATVREWDLCKLGGQVRPPKDRGV